MANKIKSATIRHYRDNGQVIAYVAWCDGSRTEGELKTPLGQPVKRFQFERLTPGDFGAHMCALLQRAEREGITVTREIW